MYSMYYSENATCLVDCIIRAMYGSPMDFPCIKVFKLSVLQVLLVPGIKDGSDSGKLATVEA